MPRLLLPTLPLVLLAPTTATAPQDYKLSDRFRQQTGANDVPELFAAFLQGGPGRSARPGPPPR